MLEQGPAATEEAASFGGKISFGGKKLRQSYDAVARFQLESRAGNQDFWDRKVKEGNGTQAAERRKLNHCIEGSGRRQEGSATLIKKKEQRGSSIKDKGQRENR